MNPLKVLVLAIIATAFTWHPIAVKAQNKEWRQMHQGNRAFRTGQYNSAAVSYMKALRRNPQNARALFNLADTYLAKGDVRAADSLFVLAANAEKSKTIKSMAYHNRGYIRQKAALTDREGQQQLLRQAIELYKQALRLNPKDEDTRYNLALCQKQLKESAQKNSPQNKPSQQKQKEQDKKKQPNQSQAQIQPANTEQRPDKRQTEQYLNLSRQAEKNVQQRIKNQQPRQKSLDKNW